jgi:hypothetical protein
MEGECLEEMPVSKNRTLVLRPAQPSYCLDDLLAGITPANCHAETAWGVPQGQEQRYRDPDFVFLAIQVADCLGRAKSKNDLTSKQPMPPVDVINKTG